MNTHTPNGLLNLQIAITKVKTHSIEKLLEHKCLKWVARPISILKTQVMAEEKVRNQCVNLTPDH